MRKLTLKDVEWTLVAEAEDTPIRGNALASGDEEEDKRTEDNIIIDLENGNEWAWCFAVLTGQYKGLRATEVLGCCSYADEADFKQPGGYYDDMQQAILDELQAQAEELCSSLAD